jgi:membrane fusion protein
VSALFRQQAIDFQRQRRHGEVILIQPVSTKVLTWFMVASVGAVATFLSFAQYSHKQTVTGYLEPVAGTAKVYAAREGVIEQVLVHQGDVVQKGQPLFTVGTEQIAADHSDVQQQVLAILRQQKAMLSQQISAEEARIGSERDRLTHLLQSYATEQESLLAQIASQQQQITLAQSLVPPAMQLRAKGLVSNHEYTARLTDVLAQRQKLDALTQQLLKLRNQATETQYTLDQLPTAMGDKIQNLRNSLADTEQRLSEANGRRAYIVRAPADGRIALLAASPGQAADPKHVQLEIIPANGALQAELLVPPRAIGFITQGETVRIRYDAFPYQEFGIQSGTVTAVSQTMMSDLSGPIRLETPVYKVTAALHRLDIDVHTRRVPLQPDMTLKADVILEQRSLFRWLLEPLYGTRL